MLWAGILNFKFKIVFLEYFFFEIWRSKKRIALSEKKPPLVVLGWVFNSIHIKKPKKMRKLTDDLSETGVSVTEMSFSG